MKRNQDRPPGAANPSKGGRRRRTRIILALGALCLLLFLVALSGLACFGYLYRVELINRATAQLPSPYDVSVEELTFLGPDKIRIDGIEVRERKTERLVLRSEEATWQFQLSGLHRGQLGNLEVQGAVLELTPADVDLLKQPRARPSGGSFRPEGAPDAGAAHGGGSGIAWNSIHLGDIALSYTGDTRFPAVSGVLDLEGAHLAFSGKHGLSAGRQQLRISNLVIGATHSNPIHAEIPSFQIELKAASKQRLHFGRVEIDAATLSADAERLLTLHTGTARGDGPRSPTPAILVDEVSIRSGRLKVRGPGQSGTETVEGGLEITASELSIDGNEGSIGDIEASIFDADTGFFFSESLAFSAQHLSLNASASWGEDTRIVISHADLRGPGIRIDLAKETGRKGRQKPPPDEVGVEPAATNLLLRVEDMLVKNAHLEVTGKDLVTGLKADFDIEADGWEWENGAIGRLPESLQALRVHRLQASLAGVTEPVALSDLLLQIVPSEFAGSGAIRSLEVARIDLNLQGAELLGPPGPDNDEEETSATAEGLSEAPEGPIYTDPSRWIFETLRVDGGHIDIPALPRFGVPHIEADIAISTPETASVPPGTHDVSLLDVSVSAGHDRPPFYRSEEVTARIDYREAWQGGGLDAFRIGKGSLEVGDELALLFPQSAPDTEGVPDEDPKPAQEASREALATLLPDLNEVAIADTRIILKDIAPGIHTVIFGLQKRPGKQRIELAHIEITSPYNPLIPVLRLNTLFLEFTLQGLLRKEIEKVEIVNPTIYVGENLFWFIEHYRTYGTSGEEEANTEQGWDIGEIHAHNGRLVIAPKGMPIPGLEVPFPFSCRTRLGQGVIEANLTIQNADYAIPDIEILLEDLEGSVEFNLPIKQVDNNLVQVLKAKKLRFRQLEGTDPWVSFTYDKNGIYTRFGAEAYGGYVKGEANVYIDDDYTWDAWAAMSDIETSPITRILTPNYFQMRGRSDASIVANGNIRELFQATGSFSSPGGGEVDVRALDGLEGKIDDTSPVTLWLAEAGIDLLQHFRYDTADGKFNLKGRAGELDFLLAGPDGRREFDVKIHDFRPLEERGANR